MGAFPMRTLYNFWDFINNSNSKIQNLILSKTLLKKQLSTYEPTYNLKDSTVKKTFQHSIPLRKSQIAADSALFREYFIVKTQSC